HSHSCPPVAIIEYKLDKVVEGCNFLCWWRKLAVARRPSSPCLCQGTHPVSGLALLGWSHYSPPDQAENPRAPHFRRNSPVSGKSILLLTHDSLPGLRVTLDQRNSAPVTMLPIRKKRCESS